MLCLLERPQPVNFNIVCKDAISLTLSWSKPASSNKEIDYYVVSVCTVFCMEGSDKSSTITAIKCQVCCIKNLTLWLTKINTVQ